MIKTKITERLKWMLLTLFSVYFITLIVIALTTKA